MSNRIYLLQEKGKLTELLQTNYETEDVFQGLLEEYPCLLAGDQINPENPRKWIFISREMGIPSEQGGGAQWYLDHLFIDQDGIPTLVEVKRSTDTRIRREVVAQMLDYAANAVDYWPIDKLRDTYEQQQGNINSNSLEDIGVPPSEEESFWQSVKTNLRAGKIRMLFVADEIPLTLLKIIEFLNSQMVDAEVLGLEIRQYQSTEGMITLVPNIKGNTASAAQVKQQETRDWNEIEFLDNAAYKIGDEATFLCRKLLRALEAIGYKIRWGHGKRTGSFTPEYISKQPHSLLTAYLYDKGISIEINFQSLRAPFNTDEHRHRLKSKLEAINGIQIPENKLTKRPSFDLKILQEPKHFDMFVNICREFRAEAQEYDSKEGLDSSAFPNTLDE